MSKGLLLEIREIKIWGNGTRTLKSLSTLSAMGEEGRGKAKGVSGVIWEGEKCSNTNSATFAFIIPLCTELASSFVMACKSCASTFLK